MGPLRLPPASASVADRLLRQVAEVPRCIKLLFLGEVMVVGMLGGLYYVGLVSAFLEVVVGVVIVVFIGVAFFFLGKAKWVFCWVTAILQDENKESSMGTEIFGGH
jgi:uncharacterized membrane protein